MINMGKYLWVVVFLVGCQMTDNKPSESTSSPLHISVSDEAEYNSIFEDEPEEDEDKFSAYFYDSRGKRFLSHKSSTSTLNTAVNRLLDKGLKQAFSKLAYVPDEINVALEVNAPYAHKDEILFSAEEYIVQAPNLSIQAQQGDTEKVIGKILKRELDPFYDASEASFDDTAKVSDLVLYILADQKGGDLIIKVSVLSKSAEILGIKTTKVGLNGAASTTSGFVTVDVPFSTSNGTRAYQVMRNVVSREQLYGVGSKSIAATNMSLEQANNYCTEYSQMLTSPYVFEFARRKSEINRPTGIANLELIAALDEDTDSDFYREEDYLELEDDYQSNHFLVFDWNAETYAIVANSFSSERMTFRCYKQ